MKARVRAMLVEAVDRALNEQQGVAVEYIAGERELHWSAKGGRGFVVLSFCRLKAGCVVARISEFTEREQIGYSAAPRAVDLKAPFAQMRRIALAAEESDQFRDSTNRLYWFFSRESKAEVPVFTDDQWALYCELLVPLFVADWTQRVARGRL